MLKNENVLKVIMKMLVEYKFQFPLSWVFIGINGSFWSGRFEFEVGENKIKHIPIGNQYSILMPPINGMVVDLRGDAMHFSIKGSGEVSHPTICRISESIPIESLNLPKA